MLRPANALLIAIVLVTTAGCATLEPPTYRTFAGGPGDARTAVEHAGLNFHGLQVRSGDIVLSETDSAVGLLIGLATEDYHPYIHASIVSIEDGTAYVYESVGPFKPQPDSVKPSGGVRRVTLASHLDSHTVAEFFAPPAGVDATALVEFARAARARKIPFDTRFDANNDSQVYCAEFVAQAIQAAGGGAPVTRRRSANRSLDIGLRWLGIHAERFIVPADLVTHWRSVGLVSHDYSPAQIQARFEFKAALHQRFDRDQRLGNLLRWHLTGPRVRDNVREAFVMAMDAAESRNPVVTTQRDWLADLLNEHFGDTQPASSLATAQSDTSLMP